MQYQVDEKIKKAAKQVKFVMACAFGRLYWTEALEIHVSLRKAKKLEKARGLIKKDSLSVVLKTRGYKGDYVDSAEKILAQIPEFMLSGVDAYTVSVKRPKAFEYVPDEVEAKVVLFKANKGLPKKVESQPVICNDNYPFKMERKL